MIAAVVGVAVVGLAGTLWRAGRRCAAEWRAWRASEECHCGD